MSCEINYFTLMEIIYFSSLKIRRFRGRRYNRVSPLLCAKAKEVAILFDAYLQEGGKKSRKASLPPSDDPEHPENGMIHLYVNLLLSVQSWARPLFRLNKKGKRWSFF